MTVSALSDRHFVGPWGLFGGQAGDTAFRTFAEAFRVESPTKFDNVTVRAGDELLLEAPGGGGYGDPLARAPERVLADVLDRNVSRQAAEAAYGVVVAADNGTLVVDEAATETRRPARGGAGRPGCAVLHRGGGRSRVGARDGPLGRDRQALVRGQDCQLLLLRPHDRALAMGCRRARTARVLRQKVRAPRPAPEGKR